MSIKKDSEKKTITHAYTPGLEIKKSTTIRKLRQLPIKGSTTVAVGDIVDYSDIIAKTDLPGTPYTVQAADMLKCDPDEVAHFMKKKIGDPIKKDEVIAQFIGFFGLIKQFVRSPVDGHVESLSDISGQIIIRDNPIPVEIKAYIPGKIIQVIPDEGAIIETKAAFIQGIFGVGGETHGEIMFAVKSPEDVLTVDGITPNQKGKIIVGGSCITNEALQKALEIGVKGIIVGGIKNKDLSNLVGYDIGVAITGFEDISLSLIVTEGFGFIRMSNQTFNLLKEHEGELVHLTGETQIRAGVKRPEIIIPLKNANDIEASGTSTKGMTKGTMVRVIREPYFGQLGTVWSLPSELQKIHTESSVRVVEIKLDDGQTVLVPRANAEIIEI
jgi:hypothetical protein